MNRRLFLGTSFAAAAAPARKIGKVETLFKTPGPHPNGLQTTKEGLWIIDQQNNKAYLVSYSDGKVIREFLTEADRASGMTFDGEALWLASTYSREIVRTDPHTGKTLAKYFTPGAGVIYRQAGDPPQRRSNLSPPAPPPNPNAKPSMPASTAAGTGAHGLEWRDGKLWIAVPPARMIYKMDPVTWTVEKKFQTSGNRPHGIGWEGKYLWAAASNLYGFFKHDPETGKVLEQIILGDKDPQPHGATIWNNEMWYCDDVGVVCKFKLG